MAIIEARIVEIGLDAMGAPWARLSYPQPIRSQPGQYFSAWAVEEEHAPLGVTLYPAEFTSEGFRCAPPVPRSWFPGVRLQVRGPLGRGFHLFPNASRREAPLRLALAGIGPSSERLLPLIQTALEAGAALALFTDGTFPGLPAVVEVYPLSELPGALAWADALALDLPGTGLGQLRQILGLRDEQSLPCPAEALITMEMPCHGLAQCGACAVPARRGWHLACEDGPVFPLEQLDW